MKFNLACLSVLLWSFNLQINAQTEVSPINETSPLTALYKEQNVVAERLHLMTDRTSYQPGQRVWMRAFVFDALTRKSLSQSEYAYVELMDKNYEVKTRVMLKAEGDVFAGYLDLPNDFQAGTGLLRAYTRLIAGSEELETINRIGIGQAAPRGIQMSDLPDYEPTLLARHSGDSVLVSVVLPEECVNETASFAISITTDSVEAVAPITRNVVRPMLDEPIGKVKSERAQSIRGYVTDLMGDRVHSNLVISLFAPLEGFTSVAVSDTLGRFSFDNLDFDGDLLFFLQAKDYLGEGNYRIYLRDPVYPGCNYLTGQEDLVEIEDAWLDDFDGKMLEEVIVKNKRNVAENHQIGHFSELADRIITDKYIEDKNYSDIYMLLMMMPGIRVSPNKHVTMRGTGINDNLQVLFVIDGIKIESNDNVALDVLRIEDILQVDIFRTTAGGMLWGAKDRGAVSITTRRGLRYSGEHHSPNIAKKVFSGYQPSASFESSTHNEFTLYWNPDITTEGARRLSFKIPRVPHAYIHIEGLTAEGKTIYANGKAY